jgi:hypothetical protein
MLPAKNWPSKDNTNRLSAATRALRITNLAGYKEIMNKTAAED